MSSKPAKLAFEKITSIGLKKSNLIVMHGLLGNKNTFRTLSNRSEMCANSDVYLLDMRNHGDSEHLPSMKMDDMAHDILNFMDLHEMEDAVLLGHSIGAKLVLKAGLSFPKRVKGLILADSGPFDHTNIHSTHNSTMVYFNFLQSLNLKQLNTVDKVLAAVEKAFPGKKTMADFLLMNLEVHPKYGLRWKSNLDVIIDQYEHYFGYKPEAWEQYHGKACVIYGTKSDYIPKDGLQEFKKHLPNICLQNDFKPVHAGHWVHFQQPDAFLTHVGEFMTNLHDSSHAASRPRKYSSSTSMRFASI